MQWIQKVQKDAVKLSPLLAGKELAEVIDELTGRSDIRNQEGAMGLLTNGHLPRDVACSHGLFFAFGPFVSERVFWELRRVQQGKGKKY